MTFTAPGRAPAETVSKQRHGPDHLLSGVAKPPQAGSSLDMTRQEHPLQRLYRTATSSAEILDTARVAGRETLLEPEGLALARLLGFDVPPVRIVGDADDVRGGLFDSALPGAMRDDGPDAPNDETSHVVVKAIAADLVHKSDAGAVARVRRQPAAVADAIRAMARRLGDLRVGGYGIYDCIEHDQDLAGELIFGLRRTPDFGAIVSVGPGGVFAEHLAGVLEAERGLAHFSARQDPESIRDRLLRLAVVPMLTGGLRGQPARLPLDRLVAAIQALHRLAAQESTLAELELNPVVVRDGRLVALDALAHLSDSESPLRPTRPARPISRVRHLLQPRSIAVVGVSARSRNPGRIVVENVLAAGFPRENLAIVKPGFQELDGCRCVPNLSALEPVDLLVVAVAAEQAAPLLEEVVCRRTAESVILIPGGVGEAAGSEDLAERIRSALDGARREPGDETGDGPVLCGANCLGVHSRPGRFDSLFIPRYKMPGYETSADTAAGAGRLALISQSGAFAIARASQLEAIDPRYLVTVGNQLDLTVGDIVSYLERDDDTDVLACYVEGFAPLDGDRFLRAAERHRRAGRPVILYRAGRTPAGASTAASHTASMSGDYTLTRELARAAGVVVAETLQDFDDLVSVFTLLHHRPSAGARLGAVSNAGFECVAMADHLGGLRLATFSQPTQQRLHELLDTGRVGDIVGVSNPLDTTPILGDEAFAEACRLVLDDAGVDLGLVGCVPMSGALDTLEEGPSSGGEDVENPSSVASRLASLFTDSVKPWVAVVDGGPLYDAMARRLQRAGVPTFRHADRAVRALDAYCAWHCDSGR